MKLIAGRYRVLEKLGQGGMGVVYKVKDLKNNKIIALKSLYKKTNSSETVQRFKREFKLLTELHHPNLCEVYDFGKLRNGGSYFTMEYIDGKDIFQTTKGLTYQEIYPLIVQVCRFLEYIHLKGLIHYDIKPNNILIYHSDDELLAKLMDFGLAEERRIKGGVSVRGTIPYIAPEVLKGLVVDQRADLYSLGILLYEIFTRKPLRLEQERSFVTIFREAIAGVQEPPSKIASDIPKGLENLVLKLIALEPAERYGRANDVTKDINNLSNVKFEMETQKTIKSYLLSSKFVGRDKEFDKLKDAYQKIPSFVLIKGELGIGKSRLLKEFKIFVQFQRGRCFTGYAQPSVHSPYQVYYEIFKELLGYIDDNKELETSLAVLSRVFPGILNGRFKKQFPKLSPLKPEQEKLRIHETFFEFIEYAGSKIGDIAIFLEDLHWADTSSIDFLEYLARNLCETNILICATYQSNEKHIALKRMLKAVKKENYFLGIELKPLDKCALSLFLDSTITNASNSPELVQYLLKKTNGNPFFVEEMMRALLGEKATMIGEKIEPQIFRKLSFPEKIEKILLKRLGALTRISQTTVKYAAVLRKGFDFRLMKKLTMLNDTQLSKSLWELKRNQVLVEEGSVYRFCHATMPEVINKQLIDQVRQELNCHVGKVLEKMNKRDIEKVVEDLAFYFINGKDRTKAIKYGLKAVNKCKKRYANEQTIEYYKGVLNLLGKKDLKRQFDIFKNLAEIEMLVGLYDDAIKHYHQALDLKASPVDQEICIYNGIGDIHEKKGEFKKALEYYNKGLKSLDRLARNTRKVLLKAGINRRIGFIYLRMGDYEKAKDFNIKALKLLKNSRKKGSLKERNSIYHIIGTINYYKGKYEQAIPYFEQAYDYYKKIKDENKVATVLNVLGLVYFRKGDLLQAIVHFQRVMEIWEKIRSLEGILIASNNLGSAFYKKGDFLKSLEYNQRAFLISKKSGDKRIAASTSFNLGSVYITIGDFKKAKEFYEKALQYWKEMGSKQDIPTGVHGLGTIYEELGDFSLALKYYKESLKVRRKTGHQHGIGLSLKAIASVLIELGELSKAKSYIKEALKIVMPIGLKDIEVESYGLLCRICIIVGKYHVAYDYYKKGITIVEGSGMKIDYLIFVLLLSEINYFEKRYSEGIKNSNEAINLAKELNLKEFYAEALLSRVKNEIKLGLLPRIKVLEFLKESMRIAEEIKKPELLWRVYFEYGKISQEEQKFEEALKYYQRCIKIFMDVTEKIRNKKYKENYINRSDRQEIVTAINEIENLLP